MCPDLSGRVTVRLLLRTTQLLKGHHAGDPPGGQGAAGDVRAVPGRNTQERSCAISTPTRLPLSSLPPLTPSSPPSDGRIAETGGMTRHGRYMPPPQPALRLLRRADSSAALPPAVVTATTGDRVAPATVTAAPATRRELLDTVHPLRRPGSRTTAETPATTAARAPGDPRSRSRTRIETPPR